MELINFEELSTKHNECVSLPCLSFQAGKLTFFAQRSIVMRGL